MSIQATDAPTPNASYTQPSVRVCSINRWISARFCTMLLIRHVIMFYFADLEVYRTHVNTESPVQLAKSRLEHSCAQSRAQWDQCGGTCESRDPGCQWPVMTIDPHCAAARRARELAGVYYALAFVVQTGKTLNIEIQSRQPGHTLI